MNKRKKIFGLIAICAAILFTVSCTQNSQTANKQKEGEIMTTEKNKASNEAQIRQLIDGWVKAFQTKDVNLMMSFHAPEFAAFDIIPPLQYVGKDAYRKVWEEAFALFQDPIELEIRDLSITTGDDVAFSRNLLRVHATRTNGQKSDYWERLTFGFRKIDGKWLITHEHVSLPTDFKSGKAVLYLKP